MSLPARTRPRYLLLSLAVMLLPVHARAQEARFVDPDGPPPPASALLAKHAVAFGDLKGRTAVSMTGTITGTGVAPGTRFERYLDNTGRYFHQTLSGATPVTAEGWTGKVAFRTRKGVAVPLTRAHTAAIREHGVAFGGMHSAAVQATAVSTEWSDFFKCTCVKVRLTLAPGDSRTELYDPQSGQLKGLVRNGLDADGKKEDKLVVFIRYQEFDGVKVPVDILEADGKIEWRLKVDGVRWNSPVPMPLTVPSRP